MGSSLQALEAQYILLTQKLSVMLAACSTQDERDAILTQYVICRRNYWDSIGQIFHDDDPAVAKLVRDMATEQSSIEEAQKHLDEIAKVISAITKAVEIGTDLATKIG